jgi:hypothetical protein
MSWICQGCGQTRAEDDAACACGGRRQEIAFTEKGHALSRFCPRCGKAPFVKVKPDDFVAMVKDRVCLVCGTRFTPPPADWHAYGFVVVGVFLVLVAPASILYRLLYGNLASFAGIGIDLFFVIVGLACIRLGRSHLAKRSDKPKPKT